MRSINQSNVFNVQLSARTRPVNHTQTKSLFVVGSQNPQNIINLNERKIVQSRITNENSYSSRYIEKSRNQGFVNIERSPSPIHNLSPQQFNMRRIKNSQQIFLNSSKSEKQANHSPLYYSPKHLNYYIEKQKHFKKINNHHNQAQYPPIYAKLLRQNNALKKIVEEDYEQLKQKYKKMKEQNQNREYLISQLQWKVKQLGKQLKKQCRLRIK